MNIIPESPQHTATVSSGQSSEQFLAGLPDRTKLAIERLRSRTSPPPTRILALRATDVTAIRFGEIEAVLGDNGFNTKQILEAAVKALYEKMIESGLIQKS